VKLLLDEQISWKVAERLRDRGRDAVAVVADPQIAGLDDRAVFDLAQCERRALVTYNCLDFIRIVREWATFDRTHRGVVFVRPVKLPSSDHGELIQQIGRLVKEFEPYLSFAVWIPSS